MLDKGPGVPPPTIDIRDAAAQCAKAMALGKVVDADVVETAIPLFVRMLRRALLEGLVGSGPAEAEIERVAYDLSNLARRSTARAATEALDWWLLAYLGRPLDGEFFAGRALHPALRQALEPYTSRPRLLTRRMVETRHGERVTTLKSLGDTATPTNRAVFEALVLRTIDAALTALEVDARDPLSELLGVEPEELVSRADPDRSVPRNGMRWPSLVARAGELQDALREVLVTSRLVAGFDPAPGDIPARREMPDEVRTLYDALVSDEAADRTDTADRTLSLLLGDGVRDGSTGERCLVSLLVQLGIHEDWVVAEWRRVEDEIAPLLDELNQLRAVCADSSPESIREVQRCLAWGLTVDAEFWLNDLRLAASMYSLRSRAATMRTELVGVAEPTMRQRLEALLASLDRLIGSNSVDQATLIADSVADLLAGSLESTAAWDPTSVTVDRRTANEPAEAPAGVVPASNPTALNSLASKELVQDLLQREAWDELIALAPSMTARNHQWFWEIVTADVPAVERGNVWVQARPAFLEALANNPELSGFLLPPVPDRVIKWDGGFGRGRSLSVRAPRRDFSARARSEAASAIEALERGEFQAAGDAFSEVADHGWRIAFGHAAAAYLMAKRPDATLAVYRRALEQPVAALVGSGLSWNIAVAYEWVGDDRNARLALEYFFRVTTAVEPQQVAELTQFSSRTGAKLPVQRLIPAKVRTTDTTAAALDGPAAVLDNTAAAIGEGVSPPALPSVTQTPTSPAPTGSEAVALHQREGKRAKEEYERGEVAAAEKRLTTLLRAIPRAPEALLLLRIYRETLRWPPAKRLIDELESKGAATWRHRVELARVAAQCNQPSAALKELNRARAKEPSAAGNAEFNSLLAQVEQLASDEARSVATLGGSEMSQSLVGRLSAGGNLDREDWLRATRRYILDGDLGQVLAVVESIAQRDSWIISSVVEAVCDLNAPLDDASLRRKLITLAAGANSSQVEALADYLERSAQTAGDLDFAWALREGVCVLLAGARENSVSEIVAVRLAWRHVRALRRVGRFELADSVAAEHLPPIPIAKRAAIDVGVPAVEPVFPRFTATRTSSEAMLHAIAVTAGHEGEPAVVAAAWESALRSGDLQAAAAAVAWMITDGRPLDALNLYLEFQDSVFLSQMLMWNVAVAQALIGQYDGAATWFAFEAKVNSRGPETTARRHARDAVFVKVGKVPPPTREAADDLPILAGTVTTNEFMHLARLLRDRIGKGVMSIDEAYSLGVKYHDRVDDADAARAPWSLLLLETGHSDDAMDVLRSIHADGALTTTDLGILVKAACKAGVEDDALRILDDIPTNHMTLMARARLRLSQGDTAQARQLAKQAKKLKSSFQEPDDFIAHINDERGALTFTKVLHCGRIADNAVEIVMVVSSNDTVRNLICDTPAGVVSWGDLRPGRSQQRMLDMTVSAADLGDHLVLQSTDETGQVKSRRVEVPRPWESTATAVRFDPTQPPDKTMFVGRVQSIRDLETHYRERRQIVFLGGPRQVGKTSLVLQCRQRSRDGISALAVALLNGDEYSADEMFLEQIADAVEQEFMLRGVLESGDRGPMRTTMAFKRWFLTAIAPHLGAGGLVLAIDEVQEMFDRLASSAGGSARLAEAAGAIRAMNADQDLPMKFMFLGSCTYQSVQDRLSGTNVAAELREELVGFLSYEETGALLIAGFRTLTQQEIHKLTRKNAYFVLPSAHDAFWRLTGGYPNHVHLLARKVVELLKRSRRRVVTAEAVDQAADALVRQDRVVVEHLLGREREREYQQQVLASLAEVYGVDGDANVEATAPTMLELKERLGSEYAAGVDRFLRLGLLRRTSLQTVVVSNGLVRNWLMQNSTDLEIQISHVRHQAAFAPLHDAGFEVLAPEGDAFGQFVPMRRTPRRDETFGVAFVPQRQYFRARPVPPVVSELDQEGLVQRSDGEAEQSHAGWVVDLVGSWLVLNHTTGRSLEDLRSTSTTNNWVIRDTTEAVAMVRDACKVLDDLYSTTRWVHGNITTRSVIRGQTGIFLADCAFGSDGTRGPLTALDRGPLRPREQCRRFDAGGGFDTKDDVFALGAALHHTLDRDGGYPASVDGMHGAVKTSTVTQVGVDDDLRRIIAAMCDDDEDQRTDLTYAVSALTQWLNDR